MILPTLLLQSGGGAAVQRLRVAAMPALADVVPSPSHTVAAFALHVREVSLQRKNHLALVAKSVTIASHAERALLPYSRHLSASRPVMYRCATRIVNLELGLNAADSATEGNNCVL